MASSVYFVITAFLLAQCLADATEKPLDAQIKEKVDKLLEDVRKDIGISKDPNGAEIVKVIKEQNKKLAGKVKEFGVELEKAVRENPLFYVDELVDKVKASLIKAEAELSKDRPEVTKNAENLIDTLKGTWDALADDVDKQIKEFNKEGGKRTEIENLFKGVLEKGTDIANELKEKVDGFLKKD